MINIDEIIQNNPLTNLVANMGIDLHYSNGEWRGPCPLHRGDNKTAFVIYEDAGKQKYKCYVRDECGSGDVIDFVMNYHRVDWQRALEMLGGGKAITIQEAVQSAEARRVQAEAFADKKRIEYEDALHQLWKAQLWEVYYSNLENNQEASQLWNNRGVPSEFQSFWKLGYCPDFGYRSGDSLYHSPSLTIPIYNGTDMPVNIRHRLINPIDPNDKYRPQMPGLRAVPFAADPYQIDHDNVLVVEGEIKAMVTYRALNSDKWQVYGIPGKKSFQSLLHNLEGKKVWICFDPDADEQAMEAARQVHGRLIELTMKIDDAIISGALNMAGLRSLLSSARKI